jgi:hypothetical protein
MRKQKWGKAVHENHSDFQGISVLFSVNDCCCSAGTVCLLLLTHHCCYELFVAILLLFATMSLFS